MINFLSNVQTSGGEVSTTYSDIEIIFWYAAFVVTVIVFIIVMKSNKNIKKHINKTINSARKISKSIDEVINKNYSSKKAKEVLAKMFFGLNVLESKCLDLKDLTKLNEFDSLINKIDELELTVKDYRNSKEDITIEQLTVVKEKVVVIENELQRLKLVIK